MIGSHVLARKGVEITAAVFRVRRSISPGILHVAASS
jgi:hypothetical protein